MPKIYISAETLLSTSTVRVMTRMFKIRHEIHHNWKLFVLRSTVYMHDKTESFEHLLNFIFQELQLEEWKWSPISHPRAESYEQRPWSFCKTCVAMKFVDDDDDDDDEYLESCFQWAEFLASDVNHQFLLSFVVIWRVSRCRLKHLSVWLCNVFLQHLRDRITLSSKFY